MMPPGGTDAARPPDRDADALGPRHAGIRRNAGPGSSRRGAGGARLPPRPDEQEALRQIRHAVNTHRRIPAELIERRAAVRANANAAWIEARAKNDFSIFEPFARRDGPQHARICRCDRLERASLRRDDQPLRAGRDARQPEDAVRRAEGRVDADPRRSPASVRADAHAILRRRYPAEKQREVALSFRSDSATTPIAAGSTPRSTRSRCLSRATMCASRRGTTRTSCGPPSSARSMRPATGSTSRTSTRLHADRVRHRSRRPLRRGRHELRRA